MLVVITAAMREEYTDISRLLLKRDTIESAGKGCLKKNSHYPRYLVFFMHGHQTTFNLSVNIYKDLSAKSGAKKYFSCLPAIFALPREPYSVQFILCVLYSLRHDKISVPAVVHKYMIGRSTARRWNRKYGLLYNVSITRIGEIRYLLRRLKQCIMMAEIENPATDFTAFRGQLRPLVIAGEALLKRILHHFSKIRVT
jgi:hypothetical protein